MGDSWDSFSDPLTWDLMKGPSPLVMSCLWAVCPSDINITFFFWVLWWAIFKWLTPVVTIWVVKAQMLWHQNKNGCWETEQRCRVHGHLCQYYRMLSSMSTQILDRHVGETKEIQILNASNREFQTPTVKGGWNNVQPLQLPYAMSCFTLTLAQMCQTPVVTSPGMEPSLPHKSPEV